MDALYEGWKYNPMNLFTYLETTSQMTHNLGDLTYKVEGHVTQTRGQLGSRYR